MGLRKYFMVNHHLVPTSNLETSFLPTSHHPDLCIPRPKEGSLSARSASKLQKLWLSDSIHTRPTRACFVGFGEHPCKRCRFRKPKFKVTGFGIRSVGTVRKSRVAPILAQEGSEHGPIWSNIRCLRLKTTSEINREVGQEGPKPTD